MRNVQRSQLGQAVMLARLAMGLMKPEYRRSCLRYDVAFKEQDFLFQDGARLQVCMMMWYWHVYTSFGPIF